MKRDVQRALLAATGRYVRHRLGEFAREWESRLKALESRPAPLKGDPGERGINGKDGRDGKDGESVTLGDVRAVVEEVVKSLPAPQNGRDGADGEDGKDGRDGKDGESVTLDEVRAHFDAQIAQWSLDFERRAQDLLHRAIERIEKPKDGAPGKDGRDGVSYDQFHVEQIDDRTVRETWLLNGEVIKTFDRKVRAPIYREIYRHGERYERDDFVTFGGSLWCALRDTESKPGTDDSWRLAVKAGRDGARGRE